MASLLKLPDHCPHAGHCQEVNALSAMVVEARAQQWVRVPTEEEVKEEMFRRVESRLTSFMQTLQGAAA